MDDAFTRWFEAHEDEIKALEPQLQFFNAVEPTFKNGIDMKWGCTACRYSHILIMGVPKTIEDLVIVSEKFIQYYQEAIEHVKESCKPADRTTGIDIEYGYYFTQFTDESEHDTNVERDRRESQ